MANLRQPQIVQFTGSDSQDSLPYRVLPDGRVRRMSVSNTVTSVGGTAPQRMVQRESGSCDISVVIGTFNRASKLPECLRSLASAKLSPGMRCEIICVDNNSTDDTRRVIQDFASTSAISIHYVFEKTQGSSRARNAGLRLAAGKIIAVTDDDCIVHPNWFVAISDEFQNNPDVDLIGGRVELFDESDLPVSIRTGTERKRLTIDLLFNLIPGCNFAFRRSILDKVGQYDPLFGPGARVAAAEDCDFFYRVSVAGYRIEYTPTFLVYHAHGRRSLRDRDNLERGYVLGRGAFYAKHIINGDANVALIAYWELRAQLKKALQLCLSGASPFDELNVIQRLFRGATIYLSARVTTRNLV